MVTNQDLSKRTGSKWFLLYVSLPITTILAIITIASHILNLQFLSLASAIILLISFIPLWFGLVQGLVGKENAAPAMQRVVGLMALIILAMFFFWAISTVNAAESWMSDGAVAVVSGIIGAAAYDLMTKEPEQKKKEDPPILTQQ